MTARNKGDFIVFLLLTPIAVTIGIWPVIRSVASHTREAYRISIVDPWIVENWWGWKWSWIAVGGPPGRWVTGIVLGYNAISRHRIDSGQPVDHGLGAMVREPSLGLLFVVSMGIVLACFCTVGIAAF